MKLSAVVLTKNEEKNIKECISFLKFCNEVVVIDDYSEDSTVEIALKSGARVFRRKLDKSFAVQRNFGLKKARGEWVLFVDADERISSTLAKEILKTIKKSPESGFYLRRLDYFKGKVLKHGETGSIRLLRLARKKSGEWTRGVHETWQIEGKARNLENPIIHHPHRNLSLYIKSLNSFSTIHAAENSKEGKNSSILKILCFPIIKFVRNWVIKLGFLDGTHGFISATTMSFHSFLSWSKLWLKQRKNQRR